MQGRDCADLERLVDGSLHSGPIGPLCARNLGNACTVSVRQQNPSPLNPLFGIGARAAYLRQTAFFLGRQNQGGTRASKWHDRLLSSSWKQSPPVTATLQC